MNADRHAVLVSGPLDQLVAPARKRTFGWVAVLFVCGFFCPLSSWAKDTIRWLTIDYPPIYFAKGDNAGQGVVDQALQLIITNLPEYDHVIEVGTISRLVEAMKRGENVCSPTMFVTEERKQFGFFATHPTTFLPPLALVTRKEEEAAFRAKGQPVSLDHLLAGGGLVLGVAAQHSYGLEVDQVIEAHRGKDNLFIRSGADATEGLLEMILKHRIDYTVAYPWSLTEKLGADTAAQFATVPFMEAGAYPRHYTFCTGNEWGRGVVRHVDQILAEALPTPRYRAFIERWLPPDSLASFRRAYDQFLAAGAK